MKTSTLITILLALAFGSALHAQSTAAPVADDHAIEIPDVSRVISRHFPQETPGGIGVLITRNGVVIHRQGYGTVKGKPLTPESSLRLASISKQFTAMCAAMLIEEGKLDPKAKVSRYLPDLKLPVKGRELLVQDLLWHISGLPNFMNKKEKASIAEYRKQRGLNFLTNQTHAEWLATMNPLREPGKLWEYTNSGYVLLARLIEVIAGEPFHQFQKRRIFDVLGMAGTTDSDRFNGSGNMATTLNDYAKWDRAIWEEDKRLLSPKGWRMLFTPGRFDDGTPVSYGFGWRLNLVDGQLASVDHSGGGSGTTAARNFIRRYLSDRTTVAFFAQERPNVDIDARKALTAEIYEAQRSTAKSHPEPGQLLAERLEKMLSTMTETAYQGTTEINEKTGSLKCDCSGLLSHVLRDQFPEAYLSLRGMEAQWRSRPLSVTFYETFAAAGDGKGNGRWRRIEKMMEVQRGDILAWRIKAIEEGQSTGHVGMVASEPSVQKDGRVRLRIIDSTRGPHSNDTRTEDSLGVGSGDMYFTVDPGGKPSGFHVRDGGRLSRNAFAFGRMVKLEDQISPVGDLPGDEEFIGLELKEAKALAAKRRIESRVIDEDGRTTPVSKRLTMQRINFVVRAGRVIRALRG